MLFVYPLLALGVFAAGPPKPTPPSPTPGGGQTPVLNLPSQQPSPDSIDPSQSTQPPIFFYGTVLIEGGGPASNVAVRRRCGNLPHTVAWTNARGQFSFQWNSPSSVIPDADESGPFSADPARSVSRGPAFPGQNSGATSLGRLTSPGLGGGIDMIGCQLEADAPGYRSDAIELAGHRAMDNPDVGVILLHRLSGDPGVSVSATTLMAPRDARKAWERGVQLLRSEPTPDPAGAVREFERAVRIYPKYADAWVDLGRARKFMLREDGAREAFLKAIDADDKRAEPFIELGLMASRRRQWPDAARYLDHALQLAPVGYPHLWFDDAEADYHVQNLDRAEKNVRQAMKVDPRTREPRAEMLLGLVLLSKQDYVGAESALRAYLLKSPDIEDWDELNAKLEEIQARLRRER